MIDHRRLIVYLYDLFYCKVYDVNFKLNLHMQKQDMVLDKFIDYLDEEYGINHVTVDLLIKYFSFQFSYWADQNISVKKGLGKRIMFSWIVGKKAFARWKDSKNKSKVWYFTKEITIDIDIDEIYTIFEIEETHDLIKPSDYEIREKRRFYNTDRGFLNCIENTTLYAYDSSLICIKCKFKSECKKLLKSKYPELYEGRLNGKT